MGGDDGRLEAAQEAARAAFEQYGWYAEGGEPERVYGYSIGFTATRSQAARVKEYIREMGCGKRTAREYEVM